MKIFLSKVSKEERDILYRLLEYSLFEESLNDGNEMNNDGLFEYKGFDNYFINGDSKAFFIKEQDSDKLLGFVMINKNIKGHCIKEFMVIPKYRHNKIGKEAAFNIFNMYKGNWEVSPSFGSRGAYIFWKKVIDEYTKNNNKYIDGVFIFNND